MPSAAHPIETAEWPLIRDLPRIAGQRRLNTVPADGRDGSDDP